MSLVCVLCVCVSRFAPQTQPSCRRQATGKLPLQTPPLHAQLGMGDNWDWEDPDGSWEDPVLHPGPDTRGRARTPLPVAEPPFRAPPIHTDLFFTGVSSRGVETVGRPIAATMHFVWYDHDLRRWFRFHVEVHRSQVRDIGDVYLRTS